MSLVKVENLTKKFREGEQFVNALSSVSVHVEEGEFVALCGPSGSGKTTLLNLMGCLDRPSEGKIYLDEEEVSTLNQNKLSDIRLSKIGFIFQDFNLIPTLNAAENIEYVLWLQKVKSAERRKRALEICARFGIEKLAYRRPTQMSRGQQQRVAIARAIVHKPRIVLGDEFTANLDHKTGADLMDFLKQLNKEEKITFVYATHDPVMMQRASRIIKMQDGKVVESVV
jgi:putative ABC transport system ATP-binding protein